MDTIISEIFEKYQVRKTKKQRLAFIEFVKEKSAELGYFANVEKGSLGTMNIVVGNPDTAKVIYTAHYDTCARLPFPNFLTPKNIGIYILYNIALVLGFFAASALIGAVFGAASALLNFGEEFAVRSAKIAYFGFLALMLFGPANKVTANDNTSGVTVLFGIMKSLPIEEREKCAFVFFDGEESGLVGSSSFAKMHKNVKQRSLIMNFDCVSDGKNILILAKKGAEQYTELLRDSFASNEDFNVDVTNKAFYPSDQEKFKCGVGVAAFNKTKSGTLYINKIHTKKDTVYQRENIDFLVDGAVKLAQRQ